MKRPNNYHAHVEPPVYDVTATFKDFMHVHGVQPVRVAPNSLHEYQAYKTWCYACKMNAYGGAVNDEEKAFRTARKQFLEEDWERTEMLLDTE